VPGCAELVGERKESGCLSLCVVKQQYLGHHGIPNTSSRSLSKQREVSPTVKAAARHSHLRSEVRRVGQCSGMSLEALVVEVF
jgi:hypothetical protein